MAAGPVHVAWRGLVDVEAPGPPAQAAGAETGPRLGQQAAAADDELVASLVLDDRDLPLARGAGCPVTIRIGGGAGGLVGPVALARRLGLDVAAVDISLRDPDDLPGNARRVVAAIGAARDTGGLDPGTPVRVGLPRAEATAGWLSAADVVAEADLHLGLALDGDVATKTVLAWLDAALDRERPFTVTAGIRRALASGPAGSATGSGTGSGTGSSWDGGGGGAPGLLNVLAATVLLWDGVTQPLEALETTDPDRLLGSLPGDAPTRLAGGRRWLTSFATPSVEPVRRDLAALGLLDADPR